MNQLRRNSRLNANRIPYANIAAAFALTKPQHMDATLQKPLMEQWREDVQRIADVLQTGNPAFNRARFLTASGLDLRADYGLDQTQTSTLPVVEL